MTFHAPQAILMFLLVLGLGISIAKHGEPKGNWSAAWGLFGFMLDLGLLYWGGFFGR